MLKVLTESTVEEVIMLAEALAEISNKTSSNVVGYSEDDLDELFSYFRSDERTTLVKKLSEMSNPELSELTAVMWVGRGDSGSAEDWTDIVKNASVTEESKEGHVQYIVAKIHLADYLRKGLVEIKR